jgi:uncharacterized membrane protein
MPEYYFFVISVSLMVIYHIRLRYLILKFPGKTAYGRHKFGRQMWLEQFSGGKDGILVVQTLRNWIMSATFLASTAILLSAGLLGFSVNSSNLQSFANELSLLGSHSPVTLLYKLLFLSLVFLTSFFAFSFSVRFLTHAAFQINIPQTKIAANDKKNGLLPNHKDLQQGAYFYFLGLRLYYLAVPFAFWIVGPAFMLASTMALLIVLFVFD